MPLNAKYTSLVSFYMTCIISIKELCTAVDNRNTFSLFVFHMYVVNRRICIETFKLASRSMQKQEGIWYRKFLSPRELFYALCWGAVNIKWNPHQSPSNESTRVVTLIVATVYLQLIQNRYMFRSFTVLQFSHQHCAQPVASDVEVVGYL